MFKYIWVLWCVTEEKTFGIVRVYKDLAVGSEAKKLLEEQGSTRKYYLDRHEIIETRTP